MYHLISQTNDCHDRWSVIATFLRDAIYHVELEAGYLLQDHAVAPRPCQALWTFGAIAVRDFEKDSILLNHLDISNKSMNPAVC